MRAHTLISPSSAGRIIPRGVTELESGWQLPEPQGRAWLNSAFPFWRMVLIILLSAENFVVSSRGEHKVGVSGAGGPVSVLQTHFCQSEMLFEVCASCPLGKKEDNSHQCHL